MTSKRKAVKNAFREFLMPNAIEAVLTSLDSLTVCPRF
jgi:hypothetical protein